MTATCSRERLRDLLARHYGVDGEIFALPGEYDLNFEIAGAQRRCVLKVMRAGCDPAFVDMQIAALDFARRNGLGASLPEIIRTKSGEARIEIADEAGEGRLAWLISHLPGRTLAGVSPVEPPLAASIGALLGRLSRALEGFDHPLLARPQKWSLLEADWIGDHLGALATSDLRRRVEAILKRYQDALAPQLKARPRVVVYNDANDHNIFVSRGADGALRASGLIDFGDMIRGPRVCEPAIAAAYVMMGPGDPLARGAALIGAFHKIAPLDAEDLSLLAPLISVRLAVSVTNAAAQRRIHPENAYLQISERPALRLLDYLAAIDERHIEREIGAACAADDPSRIAATSASVLARRRRVSPANQTLFYEEPLRLVRGERHFLYDADGVQYLDVYNNVPHVGHAHPRVVDAASRQMALISTNTRYLQDIHVDYAERMLALMPAALGRIVFLNSASEATELALRLARAATGARDMIVMAHCYHGNTTGAMDISPYKFNHPKAMSGKPDWVHVAPQPDVYRGAHRGEGAAAQYLADLDRVIREVSAQGRRLAGFISECAPSVGGQIMLPDGYLAGAYARVRAAGGVCIADDVQTGLGRLGRAFWGFEGTGAVPDIVVLGKPIGNGFPLAAVAMTDEIAAAFSAGPEFFSTFGGSSAACAAGAAVLDVLRDEALPENAQEVGDEILAGFREIAARRRLIGDVRGAGLFLGVELVTDRGTRAPATKSAAYVKNALRQQRILLGTEGPDDNVLKVRPPMTFDRPAAGRLLEEIDKALASAEAL